jgi:hypothetical protein
MPNWKKLIVSGSDANLNSLNVTTSITGSDVKIDDWGSISGSLANLTDNTPDGSGTANYITKWSDSDTLANSTIYDNAGIITIGSTQQGWSGNKFNIGSTSDGAAGMNILTSATGNAYIIFSDAVDGSASEYANQIRYSHTDNFLAIQTEGTERLRIKSGGNVGIGTSDPALRLHVHGTARATNLLLGDSSTANTPTIPLFIKSSGTNARMRIEDSDGVNTSYDFLVNQGAGLSIIEGSTTRMYIEEGGNVGIGTTSLSNKLKVLGTGRVFNATSTNDEVVASITRSGTGAISTLGFNGAGSTSDYHVRIGANATNFVAYTSNTERLRIANSGNVGIGTTNPTQLLHVYSGTSNPTGIGVQNNQRYYSVRSNNYSLVFTDETIGSERMRIDNNGNLGIGTTTPSAKLEVYSSGSTVFEVNGSQGQLFSITDSLSGSLFSVSDISGTPLFEVESDSTVTLGDYNTNTLVVTGSLVGIGKGDPDYKLHVKDNQDSSLQSGIVVERSANTQKAYFNVVGGAANIVADTNIPIKVRHGSTTRLEINTSGNSTFSGNVESQDTFILNYNNAGNKWQQLFDGGNGWNLRYYNGTTQAWSPNYINVSTAGNATFAGDVTVAGTLTAQEFKTELVSASIIYESGSTKFGDTVDDDHDFTGSLNILAQSGADGITLNRSATTYVNINNSTSRNEFNFKSTAGLRFYHGTDSTSPLFISSSGNVGIGTSSPLSRLTVAGGTGTTFNDGTLQVVGSIAMVSTSNLNAALNRWVLRPRAAGVDGTFDVYDARHSLTRLAINNSGQVTLPAYGSGTFTGTVQSTLGVDSSGNIIEFTGGGGGSVSAITSGADTRVAYFNGTDSLEGSANFTWDDSKLTLNKATIGEYLRVGSGGLRELRFSTYNTTSDHAGHKIDASSSNGEIAFATGGSARMYIGNTGNVGIGLSNPSYKLQVQGPTDSEGFVNDEGGNKNRLLFPKGGSYNGGNPVTGAIKVTLPTSWTNTMLTITVRVFDYSTGESFDLTVAGYTYTGGPNWVNTSAWLSSQSNIDRNFTVRFGHDGTKCCFYIGELTSTWSYLKVNVIDATLNHASTVPDWSTTAWAVGVESTAFLNVTRTHTDTQTNNWARNGQDVYYGSGTGNVGIGTTDPYAKLEVQGPNIVEASPVVIKKAKLLDLSLATSAYYGGFAEFWMGRYANVSNHAKSILTISLNDGLYGSNTNADTDVMTLRGDGNVGIGTDDPDAKLHIQRAGNGTNNTLILEDDARKLILGRDSIQVTDLVGTSSMMYLNQNGSGVTFGGSVYMPDYLYHSGDTDTYIGFPGANQVAIKTGGNHNLFGDATATTIYGGGTAQIKTHGTASGGNFPTNSTLVRHNLLVGTEGGSFIGGTVNYATSQGWVEDAAPNTGEDGYYGGSFSAIGTSAANSIAWDVDPFGSRSLVWTTINDAASDADGGWNKTITNLPGSNKPYMSVVYVRRNSSQTTNLGEFYHGCDGNHTLNLNDTANTNPYFIGLAVGNLPIDVWCVSIGFLQAYDDTQNGTNMPTIRGVYRLDTGAKIADTAVLKMKQNSTQQSQRVYHFYSTNTAVNLSFSHPGFYTVDGNEPTLGSILGNSSDLYLPLAGGTMTGNTVHNDDVKSIYGTASDGLEIYHDGTDSIIADTGTGNLYIRGAASMRLQGINQSNFLIASQGGNVNLYYNNANKFNTSNTGVNITGEIELNDKALLSNQENTNVDTGTEAIASVVLATYTAAFFDFVIKKGTNVRSGTVYACHDGTNVEFTETSTNDLGDTSDVTLNVVISTIYLQLQATTTSDDWIIKSLIRAI